MITNQKLKKSLEEIKNITSFDAILYSAKGKHLTGTVEEPEHSDIFVKEFIVSEEDVREKNDAIAFAVEIDSELEYVLVMFCPYTSENLVIGRMAVCQLRTLVLGESERYDRNNFIQNILLGNMLGSDIINRAKKLHIENRKRVVYVIDTGKNSNEIAVELAKNLADIRSGDFVVAMDEHNVVLVKDVQDIDYMQPAVTSEDPKLQEKLSSIAGSLVDNLLAEAMIKVRVGYGNPTDVLPKITESYQEAKMALEVGRLFYVEKEIMAYDRLGIGRLIYQLPMSLCEMFIREVFGDEVPQILDDEEAMSTISKFFENNLNISETARQLYVHRNTLVYRLERIEKSIGLDIRTFDDAMIFKIATMVLAHIKDSRQGR